MTIQKYGKIGILDKALKQLRIKKGFVCLNMSLGLIRELKADGFLD